MENGLEELWKNLSLTLDEQQDVIIEKNGLKKLYKEKLLTR